MKPTPPEFLPSEVGGYIIVSYQYPHAALAAVPASRRETPGPQSKQWAGKSSWKVVMVDSGGSVVVVVLCEVARVELTKNDMRMSSSGLAIAGAIEQWKRLKSE